ncbi:TraB/GumN family protein [Tsuneonella sp. HG222]
MIWRFALAILGALALTACGEPPREWPAAKPALWEVEGPNGEQGWLFGTIHSLPQDVRWRTPAVSGAYDQAGVLVLEIADIGNANRAAGVFDRLQNTVDLPPLSARVAPEDRADLVDFLERAEMEDDAFSQIETWGAALVLANRTRPEGPTQSVDRAFVDGGKRVYGLETFAQQYGYFDTLAPADQAALLMTLAREKPGYERIDAWLTGNLAALEKQGSEGLLADPELREALQVSRNRRWAPQIADMLRLNERPFVAVGAAHMLGDEGLPALLERAGFAVRRID